jgi:aerobic carbon-monoxide dehydrogenase medium subunit
MFPARFRYVPSTSVDEALDLLAEHGDEAKVLAGGQSLIPMMKLRLATPGVLVDLSRIPGLAYIAADGDGARIGALTSESELETSPLLGNRLPVLIDTSSVIADPLVRNLATVGGNVAHGDPANDHPATMVAVGARFTLASRSGSRQVAAEDFFIDLFDTALGEEEILTEIWVPFPTAGSSSAYVKFERQVGDYAIAGCAAHLEVADGRITEARIALTNLASTPVRATDAETYLIETPWSETSAANAGRLAADACDPWSDNRGSAAYRRRVAAHVTGQAVEKAVERARAGMLT